jgi:hypothetical protein
MTSKDEQTAGNKKGEEKADADSDSLLDESAMGKGMDAAETVVSAEFPPLPIVYCTRIRRGGVE